MEANQVRGMKRFAQLAASLRARLRASTFTPLLVRAIGIGAALVVLAWIGKSAASLPAPAAAAPSASASAAAVVPTPAPTPAAPAPSTPPPAAPEAGDGGLAETSNAGSRRRASPADPVYLNTASEDDLRRLPGVGAKRAEAILALRRRVGRFQRIEDLMRVKGIGRSAIRKWRPLVRIESAPAAATSDGGAA